ncbi:MMPL family transporter [Geomesophilobacter sediminis]|uniref:MMPL family transporter n=1 Tax=Geomesophilobacter sediminis TaxID=2798584 RepID=A0A8J7S8P7_9BACT|nr:MMPL family transporter [Geomesophilobacter sediminis]MBJ6727687.1 MMPL family transporter [Geomesophilobacter sediminis]
MEKKSAQNSFFYRVAAGSPWLVLIVALLLSAASIYYTAHKMEFLTGRDQLMPQNTFFNRDFVSYRGEFGDQEEIAVVIESSDAEKAGAFGTRLYEALSKDKTHFAQVFYPFGLPFFQKNGLMLLPLSDLKDLHRNITLALPVLKELAKSPNVETLFTYLTSSMDKYVAGDTSQLPSIMFMLDKLGAGFQSFGGKGEPPSMESLFMNPDSSFAKAGRQQVLTVLPVRNSTGFVPAEAAIATVRAEIAKLKRLPEFAKVKTGLTGAPVLENEEMNTSQRDIALATGISLALTVVLLLIAFRGILNTIAAIVSLLVAVALSFGFATLAVGHLNILSMVFAVMLIGIGIEYGIQLVLRYQEELRRDKPQNEAIAIGLTRNIWAIVMAAATVAAAFFTFVFTDFKGISELGIIAAGGVAICVLVTFTVLPAILIILARHRKPHRVKVPKLEVAKKEFKLFAAHPKLVIGATAVLCLLSIYPLTHIAFDYNLMNLQAKGLESVTYAYKLMRSKENSGYFAVISATNQADLAEKTRRLEALPTVDHVVSVNSFVPEQQQEKLAELAAMRRELDEIHPVKYEEEISLMALPKVFEGFRNSTVKLKEKLEAEKRPEAKQAGQFLAILDKFFASLEKEKDRNAVGMLQDFQGGMFRELPDKIGLLKDSLKGAPVSEADVPPELKSRFVGKTGKLLLQVAPKEEIFEYKPLKAFLHDIRSVDPHATGEPVMVYESMTIMRDAYRDAFLYAFGAIVVILLVAFRSVKYTLIGLVPLIVGILFMISGMYLFGISFNSANIIVMPLVLGIAVDSGIYIINRYRREEGSPASVIASSTGLGVLLNTLTIMASFGALMVAHHQGVFSIGAVMSLGMLACQVAFMITLPAVLTLAGKK